MLVNTRKQKIKINPQTMLHLKKSYKVNEENTIIYVSKTFWG